MVLLTNKLFWISNRIARKTRKFQKQWGERGPHLQKQDLQVTLLVWGLPRCCSGKESTSPCRRLRCVGSVPWVGKIPWRRKWQPIPVFLPGKSQGQRNLVGYSPWGRTELDTAEPTHTRCLSGFQLLVSAIWRCVLKIRELVEMGRGKERLRSAERVTWKRVLLYVK